MVDSVNGGNGPQNLQSLNRPQSSRNVEGRRSERAQGENSADEVQVSDEALTAQAEEIAAQTRDILAEQPDETLTRGQNLDALL